MAETTSKTVTDDTYSYLYFESTSDIVSGFIEQVPVLISKYNKELSEFIYYRTCPKNGRVYFIVQIIAKSKQFGLVSEFTDEAEEPMEITTIFDFWQKKIYEITSKDDKMIKGFTFLNGQVNTKEKYSTSVKSSNINFINSVSARLQHPELIDKIRRLIKKEENRQKSPKTT